MGTTTGTKAGTTAGTAKTIARTKRRTGSSDAARWRAVLERDAAADGHFLYAVSTTGVYCRPSCPSRLARRANVSFHEDRAGAERAGFRPCLRCRPELPPLAERHAALVVDACRLLTTDAGDGRPAVADVAAALGVSRHHLQRVFKAHLGTGPKAWQVAERRRAVGTALRDGGGVTAAAFAAGYESSSRFYDDAGETLGMTPSALRAGGTGEIVRYAFADTSFGRIMVARTGRGICALEFGATDEALLAGLERRFPRATLHASTDSAALARILERIELPRAVEALPLDLRGTAFQQRVWRALMEIPAGETASYADVARRIGAPRANRAVAGACAKNPVAVLVPCHRVVRADGTLSGYRWGVERKADLLAREAELGRAAEPAREAEPAGEAPPGTDDA